MNIFSDNVRPPHLERMIVGAMIALAGVLMLLDWAGIVGGVRGGWTLWPLFMIGMGISRLFPTADGRVRKHGWIMVFMGVWFLASQMRLLRFREFWPLVLIGGGLVMVWQSLGQRQPPTAGVQ